MPDSALLRIDGVTAGYGESRVLEGVSLFVRPSECVGLFGPNGHGKTTLLRTISGLLKPTRGTIAFRGATLAGASPGAIVEQGVIHVPQGNLLFPELSVSENLTLGGFPRRSRGVSSRTRQYVFDLFPRLAERRSQKCKTLSGGERQMLAIGVGLMGNPDILMLDEPTLGLAPLLKDELGDAIKEITERTSLLVVEQDLEFLQRLTDRMYMLNHGEVVHEFDSDHAIDRQDVLAMYFSKGVA